MIYVTGYPRSGNVHLTKLLAQAVNGPVVPHHRTERFDIAVSGQDRPGPTVCRGHFVPLTDMLYDEAVPRPHRLAIQSLTQEDIVVHIIRDPRDIVVSAKFYFRRGGSVVEMVNHILDGTGPFRSMGNWGNYLQVWSKADAPNYFIVRYEDLRQSPLTTITKLAALAHLDVPALTQAVNDQAFHRVKQKATGLAAHHIRSGKVGEWQQHLSGMQNALIVRKFKGVMQHHGYI